MKRREVGAKNTVDSVPVTMAKRHLYSHSTSERTNLILLLPENNSQKYGNSFPKLKKKSNLLQGIKSKQFNLSL